MSLMILSCGSDKKICFVNDDGEKECHVFQQYGLFDQDKQNPNVEYKVVTGNVVWGILGFEMGLIPPVVLFGWYLYEPVGAKAPGQPGARD